MASALSIDIHNNVPTISNSDAPYNRMTLEYMDEMETLIPELGTNPEVRALVFTADGLENFPLA